MCYLYNVGCVPMCEEYCKKDDHHKVRPCMKTCTARCDKCKCATEHSKKKCSNFDDLMKMDGDKVKCP